MEKSFYFKEHLEKVVSLLNKERWEHTYQIESLESYTNDKFVHCILIKVDDVVIERLMYNQKEPFSFEEKETHYKELYLNLISNYLDKTYTDTIIS